MSHKAEAQPDHLPPRTANSAEKRKRGQKTLDGSPAATQQSKRTKLADATERKATPKSRGKRSAASLHSKQEAPAEIAGDKKRLKSNKRQLSLDVLFKRGNKSS